LDLELLFAAEFTVEYLDHEFLLLGVALLKTVARAEHGDSTVGVTNTQEAGTHLDGSEDSVGHLLGVGDLVLAVEEVPNVEETVHAGQVEQTGAGRRPATVSQVRVMVTRLHDGLLELFRPNLGRPVTD